jgi:hypothetical protein
MPASRVCSTPGCPTLVERGHCKEHARPGPRQRGYDRAHDKRRAADLRALLLLARSTVPVVLDTDAVGMALDWDHTKRSLTCARCNRADGGRRSHEHSH